MITLIKDLTREAVQLPDGKIIFLDNLEALNAFEIVEAAGSDAARHKDRTVVFLAGGERLYIFDDGRLELFGNMGEVIFKEFIP